MKEITFIFLEMHGVKKHYIIRDGNTFGYFTIHFNLELNALSINMWRNYWSIYS